MIVWNIQNYVKILIINTGLNIFFKNFISSTKHLGTKDHEIKLTKYIKIYDFVNSNSTKTDPIIIIY